MQKITESTAKLRALKEKKAANAPVRIKTLYQEESSTSKKVLSIESERNDSVDGEDAVVVRHREDSDDDEESLEFPTLNEITKFQLEKPTTLVFIDLNGQQTECKLKDRVANYTDLQRQIARISSKTHQMYVIQNADGQRLLAADYMPTDIIRVRQIPHKINPKAARFLSTSWEQDEYYDTVQRRKKKELEEAEDEENW